ncbi:(2Fe-2S)-binding protein [Myxococcota bacterium]|nr:(2Fe-2S)-binding protein [Myxococcota bacterium]MBU1900427.1 (2Fe-2S)-binding protein [Myxococcota bacterium]
MPKKIAIIIDDNVVEARPGQTILQAAEQAGVYIPRLCWMKPLEPFGGCRLCTVKVNGRYQTACTQPAADGQIIENETEEIRAFRRSLLDMLFVEGNHYCMFCEKSGDCELQAQAYRLGIDAPKLPYLFPDRQVDASHPDIMVDHNRCILCARCVRASQDLDGKNVFQFVGRGAHKRVAVNAEANLGETNASVRDGAISMCPVGALIKKGTGYHTPIGQRSYDHTPIGADIEKKAEG